MPYKDPLARKAADDRYNAKRTKTEEWKEAHRVSARESWRTRMGYYDRNEIESAEHVERMLALVEAADKAAWDLALRAKSA